MGNIIWFLLNVKSDQQEDCKSQRHILEQVFGLFQMFSQVKREARASSKLSTYQFHTKKSCLSLSSWKIRHRRQEEEPSNELYQQLKKAQCHCDTEFHKNASFTFEVIQKWASLLGVARWLRALAVFAQSLSLVANTYNGLAHNHLYLQLQEPSILIWLPETLCVCMCTNMYTYRHRDTPVRKWRTL